MKITAIIPTFNEELYIEDAIKSVSFADEIIVIDSYSTDNTVELAKKCNVRLIQRVFDDFSTQKNFAIDQATNDWIYLLDADERVPQNLRLEILEAVKNHKNFVGFYVYRTSYFMGKRVNYKGWKKDKVLRLFRKEYCRYNGKLVHELIEANGSVGFLKNKLEHYTYRGFDHYILKLDKYAWLQAEELYAKGVKLNPYHILIKPPARFLVHYIIRLGFLDGFPGFVIAAMQSFRVLTRYIKLWLLNHKLK